MYVFSTGYWNWIEYAYDASSCSNTVHCRSQLYLKQHRTSVYAKVIIPHLDSIIWRTCKQSSWTTYHQFQPFVVNHPNCYEAKGNAGDDIYDWQPINLAGIDVIVLSSDVCNRTESNPNLKKIINLRELCYVCRAWCGLYSFDVFSSNIVMVFLPNYIFEFWMLLSSGSNHRTKLSTVQGGVWGLTSCYQQSSPNECCGSDPAKGQMSEG